MAENPLVDLAQTVMIEMFGLEETEYKIFKFSEGAKSITIGMTNDINPITVSFPREQLRIEEIKRWDDEKKEVYLRNLIAHGKPLDPDLVDSFHHIMLKIEMPQDGDSLKFDFKAGDRAIISLKGDGSMEVAEGAEHLVKEETAEEFEAKVEGKKRKRKLTKASK